MSESQPISWRSIVYGTQVVSGDDAPVGKVMEVLGSDAEDVFHGLRVRLAIEHRDVMMPANDVTDMSVDEIRSGLTRAEIERLPPFDEISSYHLASIGWLRKHLGWRKDAKGDEEPG